MTKAKEMKINLPDITIEEAEILSMSGDYACFAVEDGQNKINTSDAAAFYLEGYNEAKKRVLEELNSCNCTVDETTGSTAVQCCNICGKPIKSENWK